MNANVFSESEQRKLQKDDHEAWCAVCGILISIVSIGVCLAIIAVLIIAL